MSLLGGKRVDAADCVSEAWHGGEQAPRPPSVTCRSWLIADSGTGQPLLWHKPKEVLQPASITKVVTALVVLERYNRLKEADRKQYLSQEFTRGVDQEVRVERRHKRKLKAGEVYTVKELLYALLLPSGNDAAICLAENLGMLFNPAVPPPSDVDDKDDLWEPASAIGRFVAQMNRTARRIGLASNNPPSTRFMTPHGMGHESNVSCALDIIRFSREAMRNRLFKKIVRATKYNAEAKEGCRETGHFWQNTNTLLRGTLLDVYDGVKTGWIPNAHECREWGCLVTRVRSRTAPSCATAVRAADPVRVGDADSVYSRPHTSLFIAVLGSRSQNKRFSDTLALVAWAWRVLDGAALLERRALGQNKSVSTGALPVTKTVSKKVLLSHWAQPRSKSVRDLRLGVSRDEARDEKGPKGKKERVARETLFLPSFISTPSNLRAVFVTTPPKDGTQRTPLIFSAEA
eukprot:CAMPEP_0206215990 /NCGR_PEP_ID=MMETSP0047_2-20121206/2486_1 /ASSEMBLY_ACC=CAM_ASM_000192 /TAXON_ID=195065 /ORGANISM="Chroomonas mesostigmatica_cf, Strain CCMP1168" /LENGTH=459 /DNA_ID=CAMNT_0053638315 /DNA_START=114 /DNA_END=1494 /DNA_ORIENTATION=-